MLAKLRIGPKLLLAPCVVLLLLVTLSSGAYYAMVRQNRSMDIIVQQRAAHIRDAAELVAAFHHAHSEIYQLLSWIGGSFSAARVEGLIHDLHQRHLAIERGFGGLVKVTDPGSAERRFVEQAESAHAAYVKEVLDVIEMARVDQSISANAMARPERAFEVVALRLSELAQLERELSEQASASASADFRALSIVMPLVIVLSIAVSLLITMAVRRALLRDVAAIGAAASDLAAGKLTLRERDYGKDEISETSRALDTSIRNLNGTLKAILESARSIGAASRAIALGNADLSNRAEAQASSLEQTASSMEHLSATVGRTASSALLAKRLAASTSSHAARGGHAVERLVETLASIHVRARRAIEVADLIDSIANQASVLTLNAEVEAARWGQPGSGLAPMAGEVRSLARRASAAAQEIRELILQSVAEIEGGSAAAAEAGHQMAELASSVRQVGEMIHQISHANAQQASGVVEVNNAIIQMDQMTHQNSALVEQAAAASHSLQLQALSLSKAVAGLMFDDGGPGPGLPEGGGKRHLRLASRRP